MFPADAGLSSFLTSKAHCDQLISETGETDWRLPTLIEATSIIDHLITAALPGAAISINPPSEYRVWVTYFDGPSAGATSALNYPGVPNGSLRCVR